MAYNILGTINLSTIYPDGEITTTGRMNLAQALTDFCLLYTSPSPRD